MAGSTDPKRVVCVGGGYVALHLARELKRDIKRGDVDLVIVSRDNFHTFHGFIAEMLAGRIQPLGITSPARRIFRPARFYNAEVESIDVERGEVICSDLLDGQPISFSYDDLVIGVGMRDNLARYPGLAEHGLRLRSYADALAARNHLISVVEMADSTEDRDERRKLLTFVVAGGNYGGIEVATEIDHWVREVAGRDYPNVVPEDARVVVVEGGDRLLRELAQVKPKLQAWAQDQLVNGDMDVRLDTIVTSATPDEVVLSTGERIPARTLISCTGTDTEAVTDNLGFERDERGRIITDEFVQVPGTNNLWAGGDCAAVPHPNGGTNPPLALYAMRTGKQIGKNIRRSISGRPLQRYSYTALGDACSLGYRRAVAHVRGVPFRGLLAWIIWRAFLLGFVPAWDRKVRIVVDWLLMPFTGRETVKLRPVEPLGIRRELYEPGQVIIREGEVGHRLFLIWDGEVEFVRNGEDGEEFIRVLTTGQHFGELAVFENVRRTVTARARTRVELVSVGRHEAETLGEAMRSFGAAIRQGHDGPVRDDGQGTEPDEAVGS